MEGMGKGSGNLVPYNGEVQKIRPFGGMSMIFNKLLYPGNGIRRQEISNLREEIITAFQEYTIAWNANADRINDIVGRVKNPAYARLTLLPLGKNIRSNAVGDCVHEINTVISDAAPKLDKLVEDSSKSRLLSVDWQGKNRTIDRIEKGRLQKVGKIISNLLTVIAAIGAAFSIILMSYVAIGFFMLITLFLLPTQDVIQMVYIGIFMGIVSGCVVFSILDLIFSAIHGAIERKALNDAIDALKKLKESIDLALPNATVNLARVASLLTKEFNYLDVTDDGSSSPFLEANKCAEMQ